MSLRELKPDRCKGCGKPIFWARVTTTNPETGEHELGAMVPLDPAPPVYAMSEVALKGVAFRANGSKPQTDHSDRVIYLVSHFSTCPKASEFSGGRKA